MRTAAFWRLRKQYVTLVETLIVMSLIALIGGAVGFGAYNAVNTERFRTSVRQIADQLVLAQDIMLIMQSNVRVQLRQTQQGLEVAVETDSHLSPALAQVTNKTILSSAITGFSFTDETGATSEEQVILDFISGGSQMSQGRLIIYGEAKRDDAFLQEEIVLYGYPRVITIGAGDSSSLSTQTSLQEQSRQYYPQYILQEASRRKNESDKKTRTSS